ncbi:MAG: hypothetical protein ACKOW8_07930, partial [Flavobacteriales bacterium]
MKAHRITLIIIACFCKLNSYSQSQRMDVGNYDLCFLLQGEELHIPLKIINATNWQIINHEEHLDIKVLTDGTSSPNAFIAELPFFRTRLRGAWQQGLTASGYWEDISKDTSYRVNFTISPSMIMAKEPCHNAETKKFKTIFQN